MTTFDSAADLQAFGERLGKALRSGDIITLTGPLGAGKTTLARGILYGAGHLGEVPSPTFTLVQVYDDPAMGVPVWHADLYRLDDPFEVEALALDEALEGGALLVEWPDRAGNLLPGPALALALSGTGEEPRTLTAAPPPSWEGRWQHL